MNRSKPSFLQVTFLLLELLNPTPYEAWCSVGVYPWDCSKIDAMSCSRGEKVSENYVQSVILFAGIITFLSVLVVATCMGLIIRGVFLERRRRRKSPSNEDVTQKEKTNHKKEEKECINNDDEQVDEPREKTDVVGTSSNINGAPSKGDCPHNTLVDEDGVESGEEMAEHYWDDEFRSSLVNQALMYIGIFLCIRLVRIICIFSPSPWVQGYRVLSTSLQGFFNSIIFLYHKVHNLRKLQPELSIKQALYRIVVDPFPTTELELTGLSVVSNDEKNNGFEADERIVIREAGVENASRDMHLSRISGEEASYMLDIDMYHVMKRRGTRTKKAKNISNQKESDVSSGQQSLNLSLRGSIFSYGKKEEEFQDDSAVSFSNSKYDASTIRA